MGALLTLALVCGLVRFAATRPSRQLNLRELRLRRLSGLLTNNTITLDQAADGVVLSRQFGKPELAQKFREAEASLKKKRTLE